MKKIIFLVILYLVCVSFCAANDQLHYKGDRIVIDFNSFEGTFCTLPVGVEVSPDCKRIAGEVENALFMGKSPGDVTPGGCYAWVLEEGDICLGCQPTADKFAPGYFQFSLSNVIFKTTALQVEYEVVFKNNQNRSTKISFEYSFDGENYISIDEGICVTPAEKTSNACWEKEKFSFVLRMKNASSLCGTVCMRWVMSDNGGSGYRDEVGIDNIMIKKASEGIVLRIR